MTQMGWLGRKTSTRTSAQSHLIRATRVDPGPDVIKPFILNSAEHENFSAKKYENANKLAFSYFLAEKFS